MTRLVSVCLFSDATLSSLQRCIESVMSQKFSGWELLIGVSKKDFERIELAQEYSRQDSRITLVELEPNLTECDSYNQLISVASGEIIKPLRDEVCLSSSYLSTAVAVFEKYPRVCLFTSTLGLAHADFGESMQLRGHLSPEEIVLPNKSLDGRSVLVESVKPLRNFIGEPSAVAFKGREGATAFDGTFLSLSALELWLRLLSHGKFYFHKGSELLCVSSRQDSMTAKELRGLGFAIGALRVARKWWKFSGFTEQEYCEHVMLDVARQVGLFNVRGLLHPEMFEVELESQSSAPAGCLVADHLSYRELAYRALSLTAASSHSIVDASDAGGAIRRNEVLINILESEVGEVLRSCSWKMTKILRDFNIKRPDAPTRSAETPVCEDKRDLARIIDFQNTYIQYLRSHKSQLLMSRSWKLTRPFRWGEALFRAKSWNSRCSKNDVSCNEPAGQQLLADMAGPSIIVSSAGASDSYDVPLAIVSMIQNDARYLPEWIEFHSLLGVEKFYLFNNLSTDSPADVVSQYISEGKVSLIDWPFGAVDKHEFIHLQGKAFDTGLDMLKGKSKWIAFIDADEYLFPTCDRNLVQLLEQYQQFGALCVNWQLFGTNDVPLAADQLLIEHLTKCAPSDYQEQLHVKSIVRPELVDRCRDSHSFRFKPGYFQVTENGVRFDGSLSPTISAKKIRLNHYRFRDLVFSKTEKRTRMNAWGIADHEFDAMLADYSREHDASILRYAPSVKERLLRRRDSAQVEKVSTCSGLPLQG